MDRNFMQSDDRALADRIISGASALTELHERFRKKLELHLLACCGKSDGR